MSEPHGVVQLQEEVRAAIAGAIDAAGGQELLTEEIECTICTRPALRDPVKTPCEHMFHRKCLEEALTARRRCPNCRAEIPGDAVLAAPERVVRNMIARLLVPCPQKCGARPMRFDSLAAHIEDGGDCPETPIRCANQDCAAVTTRRRAEHHGAHCPHRREPCPTCKARIHIRDMQSHITDQCEKRRVPCQHCAKEIVFSEQQQHLREECTAPVPMKDHVQLQQQQQQQEQLFTEQGQRNAGQERRIAGLEAVVEQLVDELRHARQEQEQVQRDAKRQRLDMGMLRTLSTPVQKYQLGYTRGIFFDLQCKARRVKVSALWFKHYRAPVDWSVWTRAAAGTYRDQLGCGGWEKLCDGRFVGREEMWHRCPFRPVNVAAGCVQAFYVHSSEGVSAKQTLNDEDKDEDEAIALLPGTYSLGNTAFEGVGGDMLGQYAFEGRVEYEC